MRKKIYTAEELRQRKNACAIKYQELKRKEYRIKRLTELVNEVFKLNGKDMNVLEIATELERQGYLGTKKERR